MIEMSIPDGFTIEGFEDDPFLGDPDYPEVLRFLGDDGRRIHTVLISNVGSYFLVWIVEGKRLQVIEMTGIS